MTRTATLHSIVRDCPRLASAARRALHEMYVRGVTTPQTSIPVHVPGQSHPCRVSLTRRGRAWCLELADSYEFLASATARTTWEINQVIAGWEAGLD